LGVLCPGKSKQRWHTIFIEGHMLENTFTIPIIPENESRRLEALRYFDLAAELPDDYFTDLARIVATAFGVPIGLISIVDEEEVFFRGNYGMEGTHRVSRGRSLCSLAVLHSEPTIFRDAVNEPCLIRNPLVQGEFGLRFYAGAPIVTAEGYNIGTVCIVDKQPRDFTQREEDILKRFADVAMQQLYQSHSVAFTERQPGIENASRDA
jgi:GAF domain-containing protein